MKHIRYPSLSVEEAIQDVEILKKKLGDGPYSRLIALQALGYKSISGASAVIISALVHFGLLERVGDTYKQSSLAGRILLPESDEDKIAAVIEATKRPKIYRKLIDDYRGKSLPTLLSNVLFHNYNVHERATKNLAKNFIKSLEYSGLLNNGVILLGVDDIADNNKQGLINSPTHSIDKPPKTTESGSLSGMIKHPLGKDVIVFLSEKLNHGLIFGQYVEIATALKKLQSLAKQLSENKEEDSAGIPGTGES